jgi:hypothetical protein
MYRVQGGHMHMRQAPGDDDLAHCLVSTLKYRTSRLGYMGHQQVPQQMMRGWGTVTDVLGPNA